MSRLINQIENRVNFLVFKLYDINDDKIIKYIEVLNKH